jgi:hypothetical protein
MTFKDVFVVTATRPVDPEFYSRSIWKSRIFRLLTGLLALVTFMAVMMVVRQAARIPLPVTLIGALAPAAVALMWLRVLLDHARARDQAVIDPHRADGSIRSLWMTTWMAIMFYISITLAFPRP